MSDNLDDDIDLDESFDDFESKGGDGKTALMGNPAVKIGAIVGAALILFFIVSSLGGGDEKIADSYVGGGADVSSLNTDSDKITPAYTEAIRDLNEADIERAIATGDSSLPVPIDPPVGSIDPIDDEPEEDPLERWRRLQQERLDRELQQQQALEVTEISGITDAERAEALAQEQLALENLAGIMSEQMSSILDSKAGITVSSVRLTDPAFLEKMIEEEEEEAAEAAAAANAQAEATPTNVLVPAGRIIYAQMLTEANTDAPGPVLAEIMSGALKGSRILGSFEAQESVLTLSFNTVIYNDQNLNIDAVALDPNTTLPGLATEVDRRYWQRIVLPAAASFVEGLTSAIAESGRTSVTIQGETVAEETEETSNDQEVASGVAQVGEELGEILDEIADEAEVLIRIETGTPFGLLLLEPVVANDRL